MQPPGSCPKLPLALKLGFSAWILVWVPAVIVLLGPQNFFWVCNLANFLILIGLWANSRLILSTQWLAVALIGLFWGIDLGIAWLTGVHLIGGTAYMLDPDFPTAAKLLSFYHLALPLVTGFAVYRLGYAPRALPCQAALVALLVPLSWWLTDPERNINMVHEPVIIGLVDLPAAAYLPFLALSWIVVLLLPVHFFSAWLQRTGRLG
ncbi:MAG: hypothetical protein ACXIUM_10405 [Wenzhouxiangella sp.]